MHSSLETPGHLLKVVHIRPETLDYPNPATLEIEITFLMTASPNQTRTDRCELVGGSGVIWYRCRVAKFGVDTRLVSAALQKMASGIFMMPKSISERVTTPVSTKVRERQ